MTSGGVLLLGADYYGTLAAVRCLGRAGVHVAVADETRSARALWSRYVKERGTHPPIYEVPAFLAWLAEFAEAHPKTVLYPTNDHLAWLFAAEKDALSSFLLYEPGEETILRLLDKKLLSDACAKVGIDVPATLYADTDPALLGLAKDARFPLLIKPRTQVFLEGGIKGAMVARLADLPAELARYKALVRYNKVLTERHPDIDRPLLQEYLTAAETSISSISGFVDRDGRLVARAAMKVLQRPRKVGIGLCFESRELEADLSTKLQALCREVGYFGAFEAEFIADGDRRLLIDFNPRYYSQMAFDVARGLPIPLLVHYAARGEEAALASELSRAAAWTANGGERYCHKLMLDMVLVLQGASGQLSMSEVRGWRQWFADHERHATDAVRDPGDKLPAVLDAASWVQHFARHPRSFIRSFVLNR